jgi:20S proteasome subunit alpha 5
LLLVLLPPHSIFADFSFKDDLVNDTVDALLCEANMFSSKTEYDGGVNTFSPEGRIFQIEYAIEAIKLGSTSLGIQTAEGVLIAAEKRVPSTLVEPSSMNKILEIDTHIGAVLSGMVADARILIEHARVESQNHRFTYNEPMRVESCTLAACDLSTRFGESGGKKKLMSRPFGVSLLIAGVDDNGPQLWQTDPSGTYTRYDAQAIGAGAEAAQSVFVEQYHKSMTLTDAENLALQILKQVMEDKLSKFNVEVAIVRTSDRRLDIFSPDRIQTIIDRNE